MKKKTVLSVLLPVLGLGVGAALVWTRLAFPQDPDAEPIPEHRMTPEELSQYLQEETDRSRLRFKVNTAITVEADKKADLLLENAAETGMDIQAVLTLSDGTVLYRSELLPPGGKVLEVELTQFPGPGDHEGLVTIQAVDPQSGTAAGEAEMAVVLSGKGVGP